MWNAAQGTPDDPPMTSFLATKSLVNAEMGENITHTHDKDRNEKERTGDVFAATLYGSMGR